MIFISTIVRDPGGAVLIDTDLDPRENTARVSRTKLLDGGVYINNSGVSDGDRTVRVSAEITQDQADILWYIFNNYTMVHLSTSDGFYKAAIQTLKTDNGQMTMTILINSKESE